MRAFKLHLLCASALLALPATAAFAQNATVEEITVTARKREEKLIEVPMSISAVTNEVMEKAGIKTIEQIASLTPGIAFEASGAGQSSLTIRGSSTRSVGQTESPIGSFQDGIYDSRPAAVLRVPVDVARIEVIKGPQGTVLGRNTIAGAISVVTADPTHNFEGMVRGEVGSSATKGDFLYNVQAYVSGPIAGNLYGRLAVGHDYRKGYIRDVYTDVRGGSHDSTLVRGKLLWEPTDKLSILLSAEHSDEDRPRVDCILYGDGKTLGSNPSYPVSALTFCHTGEDIWSSSRANIQPFSKVKADAFVFKVDYETPIGTLTYLAGNKFGTWGSRANTDGTQYDMSNAGLQSDKSMNISNELRLVGESDRWTWLFGIYRYDEDSRSGLLTVQGPQSSAYATGQRATDRYTMQTLKATSYFGQVSFDVTDRLTVTAGARYSEDEKDSEILSKTYTATATTGFNVLRVGAWESTDPSLNISYDLTEDALIYFSYGSGYRAGGFNDGANAAASSSSLAYKPEHLDAFEAGLKGLFFDRRLRFTASAFLNDYSDLLVNTSFRDPVTNSIFTTQVNASASKVKGAEFDATWQVDDAVRVFGAYTYLDGKVDEFTPADPASPNFKGLPLPKMSNHSWMAGVAYHQAVGAGDLDAQVSVRYRSRYPNTLNNAIDPHTKQAALDWTESYFLADGNVTYSLNDWRFNLYIRNIFNKAYFPGILSSAATNYALGIPGEPRTFGLQVTRNF